MTHPHHFPSSLKIWTKTFLKRFSKGKLTGNSLVSLNAPDLIAGQRSACGFLKGAGVFAFTVVAAGAATITSNFDFSIDKSYGEIVTSQEVFDTNYLTAPVAQFDSTIGILESFTITWTLSGTYLGNLSTGGGVSSEYNGSFLVGGLASPSVTAASGGGGFGNGGGPGTLIELPFTGLGNPISYTQTFLVSDVGTSYEQGVLDAVIGKGTVPLRWSTPLIIRGNWSNLAVNGSGSATIVYTYAVPEASSLAAILFAAIPLSLRRRR